MELTECSETSAYYNFNHTPGKYPKEYIQDSKHGESLKSRILIFVVIVCHFYCVGKVHAKLCRTHHEGAEGEYRYSSSESHPRR